MKIQASHVVLAIGLLLSGAAVAVIGMNLGQESSQQDLASDVPAGTIGELRAEIAAANEKIARLERDMKSRPTSAPPTWQPRPTMTSKEGTAAPTADQGTPISPNDPAWYLAQYVASFQGGGTGSEYFRLAVDAYALTLANQILEIIRDAGQPVPLREKLLAMIGTARFRGDDAAEGTVLDLLSAGRDVTGQLLDDAFGALITIGDEGAAARLEGLVWRFGDTDPAFVQSALRVLVIIAKAEANRALARLFATAPDDDQLRILIVSLLAPSDPAAAMDLYRRILSENQPVRLAAARRIAAFKTDEFKSYTEYWIANESDEKVLAALGASKAKQNGISDWSAMKATGAPDTKNINEDSVTAWASRNPDGGTEWLELGYDPAMHAHTVRIHEVQNAGAVSEILAIDESGGRHLLWKGEDPTKVPGVFEITFATTPYKVKGLRISLETSRTPGWNEIDAVELVGPDGRAWAKSASASSHYGEDRIDSGNDELLGAETNYRQLLQFYGEQTDRSLKGRRSR